MKPQYHRMAARGKARALGMSIAVDGDNDVTVLESLQRIDHYKYETLKYCRMGAEREARRYDMPQTIWRLSDDTLVHCAESIDVAELFDAGAVVVVPCVDGV
jgi:hypothetical protein